MPPDLEGWFTVTALEPVRVCTIGRDQESANHPPCEMAPIAVLKLQSGPEYAFCATHLGELGFGVGRGKVYRK